ncbi:nitrous oxide reductase accessory protein NosL [Flavobacterium enshiense]|uniref:nitrous oxide reductase accessory protein NosL n=1 Tax=Flavobacterium enshiense TaxID=1341165 RepID=UPI0004183F99|nr:nitrous oxide reductase accessory protein NosL [Flavobacterium enshiense]
MGKYLFFVMALLLSACGSNGPEEIKLNSDHCDFCKMTISNGKFGAELITQKGRVYKFDDLLCMISYAKGGNTEVPNGNTAVHYKAHYVADYTKENKLVPAEKCFYIKGGTIKSPMGGNFAAFTNNKEQNEFQQKYNAVPMTWSEVYSSIK